jgi:hypothetical protein
VNPLELRQSYKRQPNRRAPPARSFTSAVRKRPCIDSHGDLCKANGNPSYPAIYVFNARTLQFKRTRGGAGFGVLVANRSGYLYEASGGASILVFAPGCARLLKGINNCICQELIFDKSRNLYAGEA